MNIFSQFTGMLHFEFLRLAQGRRSLLNLFFASLPALLLLLLRYTASANMPDQQYISAYLEIMMGLYLQMLLPFLCLLLGTSMIREEIEDGTLVYLVSTPAPRWLIFLGKYLANVFFLILFLSFSLILSALVFFFPNQWNFAEQKNLFYYFGKAALIGLFVYSSLFLLLGLFFRRALIAGILYILGVELLCSNLSQVSIQKVAVIYYLRSLVETSHLLILNAHNTLQKRFYDSWNLVPPAEALKVLAITTCMCLVVSAIWFLSMEAESYRSPSD